MVILTGTTGSGKSTTLAAMIEEINMTRTENIVTIEDPDEYMFRATNGALSVYRSTKSGKWRKLSKGLPGKNAYVSVLRQAMSSDGLDPCGVYFGTAGGTVFASADEGASWDAAAEHQSLICFNHS